MRAFVVVGLHMCCCQATWDDPFQDPQQAEALPPPPPAPSERQRTPSRLAEMRAVDLRAQEDTATTGSPITIVPSTGYVGPRALRWREHEHSERV